MRILLWLAPSAVAATLAMAWAGWRGRSLDRELRAERVDPGRAPLPDEGVVIRSPRPRAVPTRDDESGARPEPDRRTA